MNVDDVNNLMIATGSGAQIPLSQVANISYKLGPAQISREEGKRRIVIGFNVKNRDVESVVKDLKVKLDQVKLPSGYYFTYGGQFENLQAASKRLMIAVPVSLLLIFMLLYFTFHSIKQAALIFTAIPMSAIGGIFALLIRDMPFSISAGIGFIALFGVAVLNGIVLIGTFNQLEKEGEQDILKRVVEAGFDDSHCSFIRVFADGYFYGSRRRSSETFGNGGDRWFGNSNIPYIIRPADALYYFKFKNFRERL
jgi:cobalt-zinc-cadmium resistance protein CzcA